MRTFADLHVGDTLPALDTTITPEWVDIDPTLADDDVERSTAFGAPIAPPALTHADFDRFLRSAGFHMSGIVSTKTSQRYFAPLKVGTVIHTTCEVVDRYERKGREYVTFEFVTTDEQGRLLMKKRDTFLQMPLLADGGA